LVEQSEPAPEGQDWPHRVDQKDRRPKTARLGQTAETGETGDRVKAEKSPFSNDALPPLPSW